MMRSRALTLIEVLAALVVLAMVLGMSVAAHERAVNQQRRAQQIDAAADAADTLLSTWTDPATGAITFPAEQAGAIEESDLTWRLEALPHDAEVPTWLSETTRKYVLLLEDPAQDQPLISIDLLAPLEVGASSSEAQGDEAEAREQGDE